MVVIGEVVLVVIASAVGVGAALPGMFWSFSSRREVSTLVVAVFLVANVFRVSSVAGFSCGCGVFMVVWIISLAVTVGGMLAVAVSVHLLISKSTNGVS